MLALARRQNGHALLTVTDSGRAPLTTINGSGLYVDVGAGVLAAQVLRQLARSALCIAEDLDPHHSDLAFAVVDNDGAPLDEVKPHPMDAMDALVRAYRRADADGGVVPLSNGGVVPLVEIQRRRPS